MTVSFDETSLMWALSAGLLDQPMCLPEDFSLNATDHEDDHHRRLGGGAGETWAATLRTLMLFLMMSPGNFWGGGLSPSYYTAKCSLEAILKAGLGALQLSEVFCWFIDNKQRMNGINLDGDMVNSNLIFIFRYFLCVNLPGLGSPHSVIISVPTVFPKMLKNTYCHMLSHWINGTGSRDLSISSIQYCFQIFAYKNHGRFLVVETSGRTFPWRGCSQSWSLAPDMLPSTSCASAFPRFFCWEMQTEFYMETIYICIYIYTVSIFGYVPSS